MADPRAASPLAHRAQDLLGIESEGATVSLIEVPFLAQVGLRVDDAEAAGLALPFAANTVHTEGERSTLWLGPDEWLVTGPPGTAATMIQDLDVSLGERHHACVDLSANRAVLDLGGPGALEVLERGCSIDLHPSRWNAGMCAQTNLARTQVILEQRPRTTRIFVRPSFAGYLVDWLTSVAADR